SRRRQTRLVSDWSSDVCSSDLDSLGAELKRREELLLHAGAKDIEDYWDTKKLQPDLEPMPRLVLIIDEFAAMVAELPDFVAGLRSEERRVGKEGGCGLAGCSTT